MLKHSIMAVLMGIVVGSLVIAEEETIGQFTAENSASKTACAKAGCPIAGKASACSTTKAVAVKDSASCDQKCDGCSLEKGTQCEITATIKGEYLGATADAVRLMVIVPGKGTIAVPILKGIPHINRLFQNTGAAPKAKVVLHIPREKVAAISPQANCANPHPWGKVVVTSVAKPQQNTSPDGEKCKTSKPASSTGYAATWVAPSKCAIATKPSACAECPGQTAQKPVRTPTRFAILPPPVCASTIPVIPPVPYAGPALYYNPMVPPPPPLATAIPGCKCGTGCGCGSAQHAQIERLTARLTMLTAENARIRAHSEAREKTSRQQRVLRQELMETRLHCAQLEALREQREELLSEIVDVSIENARLEAKDELLGDIVEMSVENARLEAHLALAEEREGLVAEVAALHDSHDASEQDERVTLISVQLERARIENESLKAKVAELEAKVKEISARVAAQPVLQVR